MECTPSPQGIQEERSSLASKQLPQQPEAALPDCRPALIFLTALLFALLFYRLLPQPQPPAPAAVDSDRHRLIFFGKIPINSATAEELCLIKGVGKKSAQAILSHRRKHGRISGVAELRRVDGIGRSRAERIAAQVDFDGAGDEREH